MAVCVVSVERETVVLRAPLAPNIHHCETVFGGSASALAILAAWSLLHTRLRAEGVACRLVIQRSSVEYDHPMKACFMARSSLQNADAWPRFTRTLARRGKSRIAVVCALEDAGRAAGRFVGEFVALRPAGAEAPRSQD